MAQAVTEKILLEYGQLRLIEELSRTKRVEKYHKEFPELEKLKEELTNCGTKHAMKLAKAPENEENIRKSLVKETSAINKKIDAFLKEHGIPSDYDKIKYTCELCKDTGYIENEKCRCFKDKLLKINYEKSNLSVYMKNATFDAFDFKYFSKEKQKNGKSPYEAIKKAYDASIMLCNNFDKFEKSFLFFGNSGLGKTFLSGCIANKLMESGHTVFYTTSANLFNILESKKFGRLEDEEDFEPVHQIYECDLLIIDDLGTEVSSKLNASFLFDVVNERIMANKKIIISTNLSTDELESKYSERLTSRFFESFYGFSFIGSDIRKQKLYE